MTTTHRRRRRRRPMMFTHCLVCGRKFAHTRSDATMCSARCRRRKWNHGLAKAMKMAEAEAKAEFLAELERTG